MDKEQTKSPRRLFLIDGFGALVSAFFLGLVLVWLESYIGMPQKVLYFLALFPIFFAVYSFSCYLFLKSTWQPYLKLIAVANLLYCCLTIGILMFYDHNLTFLGLSYFVIELLILGVLITLEFKASAKRGEK